MVDNRSPKIAIIGSGPSGLAVAELLVKQGFLFDLIDPWSDPLEMKDGLQDGSHSTSEIVKKSKFGSKSMYDFSKQLIRKKNLEDLPISETIGGLSTVWGANVWFPHPDELEIPFECHQDYELAKQSVIESMKFSAPESFFVRNNISSQGLVPMSKRIAKMGKKLKSSKSYLGSSILAVDQNLCIKCGKCLSGCPQNAIFSAELPWRILIENKGANLLQGLALRINQDKSIVYLTKGVEKKTNPYDLVFISCGAISSACLLQRSFLLPSTIFLNDTQVFYLPIFTPKKWRIESNNFTLSQSFLRSADSRNGIHVSIYETSNELVERGKKSLGKIGHLIPSFLWRQVLAGIGFLPPELSGRIRIQFRASVSTLTSEENPQLVKIIRNKLKEEKRLLRKNWLFILMGFIRVPEVGASYHVGTISDQKGRCLLNHLGEIPALSGVHVVDSGSLPRIPVGPITLSVMVNAHRITRSAIRAYL